eukprot:TRINITY_DN62298_c0_g1_i1.p2 TRINITY_DN62298_c0_g1~~TRINITY_DN62298_c0_g1_i1.p2  ORF type:complete len:113 (+),score=9.14 TRINITY_DN62298_c0_g1_i1:180-518(+)
MKLPAWQLHLVSHGQNGCNLSPYFPINEILIQQMKGITHITLTMATMLVILAPLTNSLLTLESIPAVIILLLGAFFGSLAPDIDKGTEAAICLLYTSPSPRDLSTSRMPSSA